MGYDVLYNGLHLNLIQCSVYMCSNSGIYTILDITQRQGLLQSSLYELQFSITLYGVAPSSSVKIELIYVDIDVV